MREVDDRDILKICYLYYREERTQEEISELVGYSRFKISRILKEARKRGLVVISINDPGVDLAETEMALARKFDLTQAVVVRTNEFSGRPVIDQVGEAAARYLRDVVGRHRIMGVTWGLTVYHVASSLEPLDAANLSLVQIGGGLGTIEGSDNNMLTMMFAQKLGAKAYIIPAPVIVRNRAIRDTLFKEKKIQETLAMAKKADLVLFGVGMIGIEGLLWKSGFLNRSDASKLKESGAVGAICGRFFDARGRQCWHELDDRTIGLNLDELRNIRHKICVATGEEKMEGVLGALRGKLVDVLVTDEEMAGDLLSQESASLSKNLTSPEKKSTNLKESKAGRG
jgi:deoxyribonucleoside regulator